VAFPDRPSSGKSQGFQFGVNHRAIEAGRDVFIRQQARFQVRVQPSRPLVATVNHRGTPSQPVRTLFTKVSGLSVSVEVGEVVIGGSPVPYRYPKSMQFGEITLEGGSTNDFGLWRWMMDVGTALSGITYADIYRRDIQILEFDRSHILRSGWNIFGCFPVLFQPGDRRSDSDEFVIETVRLVPERIEPFRTSALGSNAEIAKGTAALTGRHPFSLP